MPFILKYSRRDRERPAAIRLRGRSLCIYIRFWKDVGIIRT